jgi:hypothetical protein
MPILHFKSVLSYLLSLGVIHLPYLIKIVSIFHSNSAIWVNSNDSSYFNIAEVKCYTNESNILTDSNKQVQTTMLVFSWFVWLNR